MSALLRYQWAILLRSHRWIVPVLLYAVLLAPEGAPPLASGLAWSGAVLLSAVAILTRSMLTAEPDAARDCVAAARGPVRAQFATLLAALAGGVILAAAGAAVEVLIDKPGSTGTLLTGLAVSVICLLVGSAAGALCNPPLLRHPGLAIMSTIAAVVFALAASVSPANAALRSGSGSTAAHISPLTFGAALALLAVAWTASVLVAAYRGGRPT